MLERALYQRNASSSSIKYKAKRFSFWEHILPAIVQSDNMEYELMKQAAQLNTREEYVAWEQ